MPGNVIAAARRSTPLTPNYDRDGIRFCYPENWTIIDESFDQWPRTVSAQSPHTGIWMAHWYSNQESPTELAGNVLQALRQEYDEVEAEVVSERIEDHDVIGYDVSFYCLDLIAETSIRSLRMGPHTLVLVCQAEDAEFDALRSVFSAITLSFVRLSEFSSAV